MAETREETIVKLRKRLGREPTEDEVRAARDEVIRRAYAAMAVAEMLLRDEAEQTKTELAEIRPVPRPLLSRGKALVKGVEVDLDAPLPDDEAP
jgi:hypothetical protein